MRKCRMQLAFNSSMSDFMSVVNYIPQIDNIIIEAGTPLIKQFGIQVVAEMRSYWPGEICADMKIIDGAYEEVLMAVDAGATSVTAMGNTTKETLTVFVATCKKMQVKSIIDMMNVTNPMRTLWKNGVVPDSVFIHKGRDEENAYGKILQYKEIAKIKGKWDINLGAAGDTVVVNIVPPGKTWKGIVFNDQFKSSLDGFLKFVNN
jgi:bifunctional enzyme Fae/Hps